MLKKIFITSLIVLGLSLIAGCVSKSANAAGREAQLSILDNFAPVVLRVEGYGTHGKTDTKTGSNQYNLMARRASKMDAYRNLAERVYGTHIQGHTTVQNLATRDDTIRSYVNSLVRGAKVVSTENVGNGSYRTVMELVLEPRFQNCVLNGRRMASDPNCSQNTVHGEHPSQRLPVVTQTKPSVRYHLD